MRRSRVEIPYNSGDEQDVFSPWRHVFCYTARPGVCKAVKRAYNKRVRRVVSKWLGQYV